MLEIIEEQDINVIRPLWEVWNRHHQVHSRNFKEYFRNQTFDHCVQILDSYDVYRIEVVYLDKKPLGYIVSGVKGVVGSIISLYIYDDLRGKGLGSYLVSRVVLWLKSKDIIKIDLEIYAGNEEMVRFFKQIGFRTSKYTMEYLEI